MSSEQDAFAKAAGALRPYLTELVVVGGWAHRLFRLHPRATAPSFRPLATDDVDVATPLDLGSARPPIDTLLKAAGFEPEVRGDESPPVARYVLGTAHEAFELEFIADLRGSETKRRGRDATALLAGISAQKLRHVEVLLMNPWTVHLDASVGYAVPGGPVDLRIPNPTAYLFQKVVTLPRRVLGGKQGKDVLYVFDTLHLFASSFDVLGDCWRTLSPTLTGKVQRQFAELRARLFAADADGVVAAAAIARGTGRPSPPTPTVIAATCRAGFDAVFGSL